MKLKVIVYEASEGGFWAELPTIPGCIMHGETIFELLRQVYKTVDGCEGVEIVDGGELDLRKVGR